MTTPCGYQQITDLSSAVGLTVPNPSGSGSANQRPVRCIITAQTQAVRWRDDGENPTASVGYPLAAGVELRYDGDLNKIKFIEQTASAALNVSYYY